MKYFISILILLAFYKSIFYAIFEYKEKNNKLAGIGVYVLSFIGLLFPIFVLLSYY